MDRVRVQTRRHRDPRRHQHQPDRAPAQHDPPAALSDRHGDCRSAIVSPTHTVPRQNNTSAVKNTTKATQPSRVTGTAPTDESAQRLGTGARCPAKPPRTSHQPPRRRPTTPAPDPRTATASHVINPQLPDSPLQLPLKPPTNLPGSLALIRAIKARIRPAHRTERRRRLTRHPRHHDGSAMNIQALNKLGHS